ncbi:hypothetical protein G3M54_03810 [Bacillus megaterium NBRC 15308 = ATCC 14581]|nr:hypothetical protein [Priestia megaterium NBRC 15308 = ATCC 14581]
MILGEDEQIFAYIRNGADEKLLVINNFYGSEKIFELPEDITLKDIIVKYCCLTTKIHQRNSSESYFGRMNQSCII